MRPTSPVRPPGPGRSGRPAKTSVDQSDQQRRAPAAARRVQADRPVARSDRPVGQVRRTSFVLLLLGLLGGGLVCLLVVNTTLAANSIEITNLQKQNATRSEQVQELQQQVASARSASTIAKEARRLGLRPDPELIFINLRTKTVQAPRGAAAAALAARIAAGWPTGPAGRPGAGHSGAKPATKATKKPTSGGPGQ